MAVEWRTLVHPNGKAEVITASPWEAVGAFLTIEAGSPRVVAYIMEHLAEILEGRRDRLGMTFNIFSLEADRVGVTITEDEDLAPGAPRNCRLSMTEFCDLLAAWADFLSSRQRHSGS